MPTSLHALSPADDDARRGFQHVSAPVSRILARIERQRLLSMAASLLQSAQAQDDPSIIAATFRQADRLRAQAGESWAALLTAERRP